jgi:hypothetical protein
MFSFSYVIHHEYYNMASTGQYTRCEMGEMGNDDVGAAIQG